MIGKSLFYDGKKLVFTECGRKWGKTQCIPYVAYRWMLSFPDSVIYIIGPFAKQMKEIAWADGRITRFLSKELMAKYSIKINQTEMRVTCELNNSFIKLDGADNYEGFRGPNPHLVIYDEFKDHHPKFHEGMEPNLMSHKAPLVVFGTPPDTFENLFCKLAQEAQDDPDGAYFNMPSHVNPHLDREWLNKMKQKLIKRGEWDVWMREYMAKRVVGGSNAIFPMLNKNMVKSYDDMVKEVKYHYKSYDFFVGFDPGTSSCFAGLFVAIHRKTKKILILNEIYATDMKETSTGRIMPRALEITADINDYLEGWLFVYDNAAAWFYNEVIDTYEGVTLIPCEKDLKKKEQKLSLIKDAMLDDLMDISDRCKNFYRECESYCKDKKGKIPKENDHTIDCLRYILNAAHYTRDGVMELEKELPDNAPRAYSIQDDMRSVKNERVEDMDMDMEYFFNGGSDD